MHTSTVDAKVSHGLRRFMAWLALGLWSLAAPAMAALSLSPTAISLQTGQSGDVRISGAAGQIEANSENTAVATVTVSGISSSSATLRVLGRAAGTTTVTVKDRNQLQAKLSVTVVAAATLSVTPSSISLPVGSYGTVSVRSASGGIQAQSSDTAVATVTLTNVTATGATLNIVGRGAGSTTIQVRDAAAHRAVVTVSVTAPTTMSVSPTTLSIAAGATASITASRYSGTVAASSNNTGVATVSVSANVVTVRGIAAGMTLVVVRDSMTTINVPVTVTSSTGGTTNGARYALLAWNDLGMHCVDGKDYSMFSILPPYNNLHAQLVNASTGKAVTTGVTLTYEAVADPTGSINTTSVGKTNFWSWAGTIFGASPAPDIGLTGNATPSRTARPMVLDAANGWFEATALPITPYDDNGNKNFYPTVKVTARDAAGNVLASSTAVLPVSDEMTCATCHASTTDANPARQAAMPKGGWVVEANAEINWKKNILLLHDQKQAGNAKYAAALTAKGLPAGLYQSALAGTPALCAGCHVSNALPGYGLAGVSALTSALHANHAKVIDPATAASLDASSNRNACYNCHPGSVTKCLRGAMGNVVDASGNVTMGCQSCHGNMTKVGDASRAGWLDEPNCQACHFDGQRALSAVDAAGNLIKPTDTRFATNPNTPAAGFSLFRFSKDHGGMQCESCHGATHAEYPSSDTNDNLQSIALQGYKGTVRECTVCHTSPPLSASGGPHGMHTIGATWVKEHHDLIGAGGGLQGCAYCHGSDFRGTALSQVKAPRTYLGANGMHTYAAGQNVSCYDCHNGPRP